MAGVSNEHMEQQQYSFDKHGTPFIIIIFHLIYL